MVSYVVTGANRGIGLAFVRALHARQKRSARQIICAIVQDLNSCEELLQLAGPDLYVIQGDLDKPETLHVRTVGRLPSRTHVEWRGFIRPLLQKLPR